MILNKLLLQQTTVNANTPTKTSGWDDPHLNVYSLSPPITEMPEPSHFASTSLSF